MDYEKGYFDKLVGQESTNKIFNEIESKFNKYPEEISAIKFLYRNVQYNKFRFLEEFNRGDGWQFDKEGLKKLKAKLIKLQLPFTLWSDILFFELNSFITNVIRTINFTLELKLKNYDNHITQDQVSIGQYMHKRKIYSQTMFYSFFEIEWNNWIKKINGLRNKVIHKDIITKTEGVFIVSAKLIEDKIEKNEQKILSIKKYGIIDLKKFIIETTDYLDKFIINLFIKLDKCETKNTKNKGTPPN